MAQAIFHVAEHGIGIPQSERAVVFSPFQRTAAAHTSAITGTRLGLYISRRIVEAHGGDIQIEDTPGVRTTFTVTLPLAKS